MSLVWTFVCLATRFGFEARPIGYPGTVIAAIKLPESKEWLYVDLFREELTTQTEAEISVSLQPRFPPEFVQPATTQSIITRAINNVFVSAMRGTTVQWTVQWTALYLVTVFFASQGISDNTTNELWKFTLRTVNERGPLDLIPIIHDRLLGPDGTSFSPAEANITLQLASLKCGEEERPAVVVRADEGGSGDEERQLAVGMMIGSSHFIIGFIEKTGSVTVLNCHNKEQPIRESAVSLCPCTPLHFELLNRMLTNSRGYPVLDRHRSVESVRIRRRNERIRGRFVRDRDGDSESTGTPYTTFPRIGN